MKWGKPRILLLVIVALSAVIVVVIGLLFAIDPWVFALLVLFAFSPPAVYLFWLRNTERYEPEPWLEVVRAFAWGAVVGLVVGLALSLALIYLTDFLFEPLFVTLGRFELQAVQLLIVTVVIAPFAEEFAKGLAVLRVRKHINELEDGIVYGASAGLGFAAIENLIFGAAAFLLAGLESSLLLIGVRSFSAALLHASATGVLGYGIARGGGLKAIIPFYLLAVFLHGIYNFFATLGVLLARFVGPAAIVIGALGATLIAITAYVLAWTGVRFRDTARAGT